MVKKNLKPKTGNLGAWSKVRRTKSDMLILGALGGLTGEAIVGGILLTRFLSDLNKKFGKTTTYSVGQGKGKYTPAPSNTGVQPQTTVPTIGGIAPSLVAPVAPALSSPTATLTTTPEVTPLTKPSTKKEKVIDYEGHKIRKINQGEFKYDVDGERWVSLGDAKQYIDLLVASGGKGIGHSDKYVPPAGENHNEEIENNEGQSGFGSSAEVERILNSHTAILTNIDSNTAKTYAIFAKMAQGSEIGQDEDIAEKRRGEFINGESSNKNKFGFGKKETEKEGSKPTSLLESFEKGTLSGLGFNLAKKFFGMFSTSLIGPLVKTITRTIGESLSTAFGALGPELIAGIGPLVIAAVGAGIATKINLDKLAKRHDEKNIKDLRDIIKQRIDKGEKFEDIKKDLLGKLDPETGKPAFTEEDINRAATGKELDVVPGTSPDLSKPPEAEGKLPESSLHPSGYQIGHPNDISFEEQQKHARERAEEYNKDNPPSEVEPVAPNPTDVSFEEQQKHARERAEEYNRTNSPEPQPGDVSFEEQQKHARERAEQEPPPSQVEPVSTPPAAIEPIDKAGKQIPPTPKEKIKEQKDRIITTIPLKPKPISGNVETAGPVDINTPTNDRKKLALIRNKVKQLVVSIGHKLKVPTEVLKAVLAIASHESQFTPWAVNKNKNGSTDYGVMQLNTTVLDSIKKTDPTHPVLKNPLDPVSNIQAGISLFDSYYSKIPDTKGDIKKSLFAYASGIGGFRDAQTGKMKKDKIDLYNGFVTDETNRMKNFENDPVLSNSDLSPTEISSLQQLPPHPTAGITTRNASLENDVKAMAAPKPIVIPMPASQNTAGNKSSNTTIIAMGPRNTEDTFKEANLSSWRRT